MLFVEVRGEYLFLVQESFVGFVLEIIFTFESCIHVYSVVLESYFVIVWGLSRCFKTSLVDAQNWIAFNDPIRATTCWKKLACRILKTF